MSRRSQWLLAAIVLVIVTTSAFTAGVSLERAGVLPGSVRVQPPHLVEQFSVFWQAWELVEQRFVDRSAVEPRNMTYGAIEGMLAALGDTGHTRFMTPEDAEFQSSDIAGQYQGIGAELGQKDGNPIIVAPLDGSPAQEAGIQAGDILVEVDGQQVIGMSPEGVMRLVRGPEGTRVTLTVIHPDQMSLSEVVVTRARIQLHPVSWTMIPGSNIAHLRVSQFSANANQELVDAIDDIRLAGARALVVDMRGNTGGLLDQAVFVTSQFLPSGNVLLEEDSQGNRKAHAALRGGKATDFPMVVLVNQGTASGAEIFAGAIQDNRRGQIVGETTFGTGTVLSTYSLSDGSALLLGTSQWLTPSGRQIWKHGIEPDIEVTLPPDTSPVTPSKAREMTPDEFRASGDTQLQKAIELLKSQPRP